MEIIMSEEAKFLKRICDNKWEIEHLIVTEENYFDVGDKFKLEGKVKDDNGVPCLHLSSVIHTKGKDKLVYSPDMKPVKVERDSNGMYADIYAAFLDEHPVIVLLRMMEKEISIEIGKESVNCTLIAAIVNETEHDHLDSTNDLQTFLQGFETLRHRGSGVGN